MRKRAYSSLTDACVETTGRSRMSRKPPRLPKLSNKEARGDRVCTFRESRSLIANEQVKIQAAYLAPPLHYPDVKSCRFEHIYEFNGQFRRL